MKAFPNITTAGRIANRNIDPAVKSNMAHPIYGTRYFITYR